MKYLFGVLAVLLFVVGVYVCEDKHFLLGMCMWLGSGVSTGLALRADTKEWEKKFLEDLSKNKSEEGNASD